MCVIAAIEQCIDAQENDMSNYPAGVPSARREQKEMRCPRCGQHRIVVGVWELGSWAPIYDDDQYCQDCPDNEPTPLEFV